MKTLEEIKTKATVITEKIFFRLMENHNTITPDMKLHIKDVLIEELIISQRDTEPKEEGKGAEEIFQCDSCGNMWNFKNNFCPKCRHPEYSTFIKASLPAKQSDEIKDIIDCILKWDTMHNSHLANANYLAVIRRDLKKAIDKK